MSFSKRHALLALVVCLAVPGLALAGQVGHAGGQSLKLTATVKPSKAGAKGATVGLAIDYGSTVPGHRFMGNTKEIRVSFPAGARFNTSAPGVCNLNAFAQAKDNPAVCPKSSIVGGGSLTADARPLLATPVPGQITIYNGVYNGKVHDLIFFAHTKFTNVVYYFKIFNGNHPALGAFFTNSTTKSLFTLKTVDVTLHNSSNHKAFITNPPTCHKTFPFAMSISNYGAATVRATDQVRCTKR